MSRMGRNPFQAPKPPRPDRAAPGPGPSLTPPPRMETAEKAEPEADPRGMGALAASILSRAAVEIPVQGILLAVKTVGFVAGLRKKQ